MRLEKAAPFGMSWNAATMCPVGSQTKAVRFQYSLG